MKKRSAKEEREVLDADTLAALDEGLRSESTDREFSWEEVEQFAKSRRLKWQGIIENQSA